MYSVLLFSAPIELTSKEFQSELILNALIGLKDTKVPVLITMFAYWGVGLGGGYLMAFTFGWSAIGLWLGLVLGLLMGAVLLTGRFYLLTSEIEST
ncbi:hypothetical protein [uncultured Nostoc sp.]|uniref:hypothetical protein n=1 Tax=uncultured Nostoc sp. TaxID=340711 RepID=UPI0035CC2E04